MLKKFYQLENRQAQCDTTRKILAKIAFTT